MFAINHAATALVIKREFANVPIIWALVSVQFMELIWVGLNLLGIERTTTEKDVDYVGDIHLEYMPFSHSVSSMLFTALLAWSIFSIGLKQPDIALVVSMGIISHLILDLITHTDDIALAPFYKGPKVGFGLYERFPMAAFILEIGYGVACWWVYKGGWALLATIVLFNLANISMFSRAVPGIEKRMANRPKLISVIILVQILVTLSLVGIFS
jgi:hypothetical protein